MKKNLIMFLGSSIITVCRYAHIFVSIQKECSNENNLYIEIIWKIEIQNYFCRSLRLALAIFLYTLHRYQFISSVIILISVVYVSGTKYYG